MTLKLYYFGLVHDSDGPPRLFLGEGKEEKAGKLLFPPSPPNAETPIPELVEGGISISRNGSAHHIKMFRKGMTVGASS